MCTCIRQAGARLIRKHEQLDQSPRWARTTSAAPQSRRKLPRSSPAARQGPHFGAAGAAGSGAGAGAAGGGGGGAAAGGGRGAGGAPAGTGVYSPRNALLTCLPSTLDVLRFLPTVSQPSSARASRRARGRGRRLGVPKYELRCLPAACQLSSACGSRRAWAQAPAQRPTMTIFSDVGAHTALLSGGRERGTSAPACLRCLTTMQELACLPAPSPTQGKSAVRAPPALNAELGSGGPISGGQGGRRGRAPPPLNAGKSSTSAACPGARPRGSAGSAASDGSRPGTTMPSSACAAAWISLIFFACERTPGSPRHVPRHALCSHNFAFNHF